MSPLYLDLGGDHRDAVFVAGSGRSGTTWLAELINHINHTSHTNRRDAGDGYRYVFEPFNPAEVPLARPFGYRRYMRPAEENPELRERARRIVCGEVHGPWTDRFHRKFVARKRLIKDIRANLFLGWLAASFPEMPIVLILRHPCAVALSRVRLGWRPRLEEFLEQPDLVQDFLAPVASEIRALRTGSTGSMDFERHVLAWCIENYAPLAQLGPSRAHLVFYERLCESPRDELHGISRYLGTGRRDVRPEALRSPSELSRSDSAVVSGGDAVGGWRGELTGEQVRRAMNILGLFGLDRIYGASPMPDTEVAWEIVGRKS